MSPSGYSGDIGLRGENGECKTGGSSGDSTWSGSLARRGGKMYDYDATTKVRGVAFRQQNRDSTEIFTLPENLTLYL